jgi:hypothetical protein
MRVREAETERYKPKPAEGDPWGRLERMGVVKEG